MRKRAFSLLEILIAISVLGVLASIAYVAVGGVAEEAREHKLASDVDTLNRAVQVYLSSGGNLDSAENPAQVIARLKSAVSRSDAMVLPGMSSQLVDSRLTFKVAENGVGVVWDATNKRFVTGGQSDFAIEEFFLDDDLADAEPGEDSRTASMKYSAQSGWIWDFQERELPAANAGSTELVMASSPDPLSSPTEFSTAPSTLLEDSVVELAPPALSATEPESPPSGTLMPPAFSIIGDKYPMSAYDLPVSLTNLNPAGSSEVVYAIDFGVWQTYSGPISLPPGSTLSAQALSISEDWGHSAKIDQFYDADPITLSPPVITTSSNLFGLFFNRKIAVSLFNPNDPENSIVQYRVNGGPWTDYVLPFELNRWNYLAGANIEARTISSGSPYYLTGLTTNRFLPISPLDLTGEASGQFHDPTGQSGMVSNLSSGNSSSTFSWGEDQYSALTILQNALLGGDPLPELSQSWLHYNAGSFSTATPGERFVLGSLDYYNGSILENTGANTIDLQIGLNLDVNGSLFNPFFDFSFDLVNTLNVEDPLNPWPDADYVQVVNPSSSRTIIINDYEYEFRLEFGETSADGFSTFDQFHVLEGATASANLYGTFIEIGKATSTLAAAGIESGQQATGSKMSGLASLLGFEVENDGPSVVYQVEEDGTIDLLADLHELIENPLEQSESDDSESDD
ncbi:MAG: type II secretion system protein [Verrucomicrobiae bacterium]|nr:type II secretion system protein [Verrucomicrobiae bacterium]